MSDKDSLDCIGCGILTNNIYMSDFENSHRVGICDNCFRGIENDLMNLSNTKEIAKDVTELIDDLVKKENKTDQSRYDEINSPEHYTIGGIETIDYIKAKLTREEYIGYIRGSVLAYISRAPFKRTPLKDYKKSRRYLDILIKFLEEEVKNVS